jgi:hypothetical protein
VTKPLTHPALSTPAKVIYFVGWISPRPNHQFAAFLRFIAGSGAYEELGLDSTERRDLIAQTLERYLKREDWKTLSEAVSMPGGVSASAPIVYQNIPVMLWPAAETAQQMKSPLGRGPGGGYAA